MDFINKKANAFLAEQERSMQFTIQELKKKNTQQLRSIFSTIPKTENQITLVGNFYEGRGDMNVDLFQKSSITKPLFYFPKHITKVVFKVDYLYLKRTTKEYVGERTVSEQGVPIGTERVYRKKLIDSKQIGLALKYYLADLPKSVKFVALEFFGDYHHEEATLSYDLAQIVKTLSPHVLSLDIVNFAFKDNYDDRSYASWVFRSIPKTVLNLSVGNIPFVNFFHWLNPEMKALSLYNSQLADLSNQTLTNFTQNFPLSLASLDLSRNRFHSNPAGLEAVCLALARLGNLKTLGLSGNELATLTPPVWAQVVAAFPLTLEELDIGENGLLLGDRNSFEGFMNTLPNTLRTLRLSEKGNQLTSNALKALLPCIPGFIKTVSFSNSDLLGLSISDFLEVISWLPDTVENIDLSANALNKKRIQDLVLLLSQLPSFFRGLKLHDNFLASFDLEELYGLFSKLSPYIKTLDVSGNGFDCLLYSQMQAVWRLFPSTVKQLRTGSEDLTLRNDGALVPYQRVAQTRLFQSPKRLHHQAQFAELLVVMKQLALTYLSLDIGVHLLSYVLAFSEQEIKRLGRAFLAYPISSSPPTLVTASHESECLSVMAQRIKNLHPTDTCLDLSHCGLNRLVSNESQEKFKEQLKTLPEFVTVLKWRGNGFLHNSQCQKVFAKLMRRIPKKITCLDLSANGLENQSVEELGRLLLPLPSTVALITLDHEEPLAPLMQIAKRRWPQSYWKLIRETPNTMQQARVILEDYTKGDSALRRFVSGHWNRHHIGEVTRLVHYINQGLITSMEDLIYEIEQIKTPNTTGSLARRFSFLAHKESKPRSHYLTSEDDEQCEAILPDEGYQFIEM